MDTQKRLHENISALADGELPDSERDLAFAALDTADGQATWRAYHVTGDALRQQADGVLSDGFSAALAARLAGEAAHDYTPFGSANADGAGAAANSASPGDTGGPAEAGDFAERAEPAERVKRATSEGHPASSADVILP